MAGDIGRQVEKVQLFWKSHMAHVLKAFLPREIVKYKNTVCFLTMLTQPVRPKAFVDDPIKEYLADRRRNGSASRERIVATLALQ